jgi:sialic acid synthase SpsE
MTEWPEVIAEIGINHDGDEGKVISLIGGAYLSGCKCVKLQCHIVEDEYIPAARNVIPPNATESIYDIMQRCSFEEQDERGLKEYTERLGMQYLCTPFSRAAADRLERLGVTMYKIGSGECNNYPLIKHINSFGKPVILSTGMNNIQSIEWAVDCLTVPFALLHCTSLYPTPYNKVRLGAIAQLQQAFPGVPVGLSDHSQGIYTSLAAVALGATIIEKHFTMDRTWPGPDNSISIEPDELADLVIGVRAIKQAMGGEKGVLPEEQPVIDFAYSSVVSVKDIQAGEALHSGNIWVKRPGGGIPPAEYESLFGTIAIRDIPKDVQIEREMLCKS